MAPGLITFGLRGIATELKECALRTVIDIKSSTSSG